MATLLKTDEIAHKIRNHLTVIATEAAVLEPQRINQAKTRLQKEVLEIKELLQKLQD